jgi:hypothetical protein
MLREFWFAGADRRYWWLSALLMAMYAGTWHIALTLAPTLQPAALRALAVLSPVLPVTGFVWLEYRRIRATDELRQRMELESGVLALAVCVPLLMALGLLDEAGVLDIDLLFAAPVLLSIYLLAQLWAHWRYR